MEQKPFWKSKNFWHNLITLLSTVFVGVNATEILNAASGVVDAVLAEKIQLTQIVLATITLGNVLYHILLKKKPVELPK